MSDIYIGKINNYYAVKRNDKCHSDKYNIILYIDNATPIDFLKNIIYQMTVYIVKLFKLDMIVSATLVLKSKEKIKIIKNDNIYSTLNIKKGYFNNGNINNVITQIGNVKKEICDPAYKTYVMMFVDEVLEKTTINKIEELANDTTNIILYNLFIGNIVKSDKIIYENIDSIVYNVSIKINTYIDITDKKINITTNGLIYGFTDNIMVDKNTYLLIKESTNGKTVVKYDDEEIILDAASDEIYQISNYLIDYVNIVLSDENYKKSGIINSMSDIINIKKIFSYVDYESMNKNSYFNMKMSDIVKKIVESIKFNNDDIMGKATNKYMEKIPLNYGMLHKKHIEAIMGNLKIFKYDIKNDITEDFIKLHDELLESDNKFSKSCDTFSSIVTLSNWYDEIKNNNVIGVLIKINSCEFAKNGIFNIMPMIEEITTTYMPAKEYLDTLITYFDDQKTDYGDINSHNIIKGNGIGNANAIIPLYINKEHWKLAKQYIPYILGTIIAHNPLSYKKNHINFMFDFLANIVKFTFFSNTIISLKWIKLYIAVQRTCIELMVESGHNVKKLVDNYSKSYKNYIIAPTLLLGQLPASSYISSNKSENVDNINQLCQTIITNELIKLGTRYKPEYLKTVINIGTTELNFMLENFKTHILDILWILIGFRNMVVIMNKFIKTHGGFIKYINLIDNNYGNLPDDYCYEIIKEIKKCDHIDNLNYEEMCKLINHDLNDAQTLDFICMYMNRGISYYGSEKGYTKPDCKTIEEVYEKYKYQI